MPCAEDAPDSLQTWEGRRQIFETLARERPRHIWFHLRDVNQHLSPEDTRSSMILHMLLATLFRHQMCQGLHLHACLPEEFGKLADSCMLDELCANTLKAQVRHSDRSISCGAEQSSVWTSSRQVFVDLDCRRRVADKVARCLSHRQLQISALKAMLQSMQLFEDSVLVAHDRENRNAEISTDSNLQTMLKRRRLTYKQSVSNPAGISDPSPEDRLTACREVFRDMQGQLTRGTNWLSSRPVWEKLQKAFPEIRLEKRWSAMPRASVSRPLASCLARPRGDAPAFCTRVCMKFCWIHTGNSGRDCLNDSSRAPPSPALS